MGTQPKRGRDERASPKPNPVAKHCRTKHSSTEHTMEDPTSANKKLIVVREKTVTVPTHSIVSTTYHNPWSDFEGVASREKDNTNLHTQWDSNPQSLD